MYNSFISIVLLIISEKDVDSLIIPTLKDCISRLAGIIEDNRLINVLYAIGENPEIEISENNKEFINILDLYTEGKYEKVIEELDIFFPKNPNIFALYEIYSKCIIIKKIDFHKYHAYFYSSSCHLKL